MPKRNQSFFEDLIEIAALMPWWLGIILAVISYFLFHLLANIEILPAKGLHDMGGTIWTQMIKTLSMFLQFVIPIAFMIGAAVSGTKQLHRSYIIHNQSSINSIRDLSWQNFEKLIGEAFRNQGYLVTETTGGADGGVDLILNKDYRKYFVQCKHWKRSKVGVKEVRELNGVVSAKGAYGGILVTSGTYTIDAINFAKNCPIELIDGNKLSKLIPHINQTESSPPENPDCPKCGSEMVLRTAKKGVNAGNQFWGCSTFPKCKGTMSIT